MSYTDPLEVIQAVAYAFRVAEHHLTPVYGDQSGRPVQMREPLDFLAFMQQFSDTSCGFGGMAGQAFTAAPVVVVFRQINGEAAVFVGTRFAYLVKPNDHPNQAVEFWQRLTTELRTFEAWSWKRMTAKEQP